MMDRAIILASGPSLVQEDIALAMASGWPVIAVNSTWQAAPDCDVIYAGDIEWWHHWRSRIESSAERWTCHAEAASRYGLKLHVATGCYNSGMRAIQFAYQQGARHIALLGFDCSTRHGTHWHGEHPAGLRNPGDGSEARWQGHFAGLAGQLTGADIVNCSRYTALTLFRRQSLAQALEVDK
ncbi:hypothetical protein ACEV6Q_17910 [Enterobacter ludwigii]|uniref:hypothetical protein n=1 Tax=Enterobacter ludwigii TaxID=299767 RepID=UPI003BEEE625